MATLRHKIAAHSSPLRLHLTLAGVLIGLCAALYAWTADFPMEFDDLPYLSNNSLVTDTHSFARLGDVRELARSQASHGLQPDIVTNFILRPVAYATFHLNYLLDGFNPRWFRVFNIGVHAANGLLIYALLTLLLGRTSAARQSVRFIAATTALLFTAHPLATESVTYIAQRFTSLGTCFFLLTLWLHFLATSTGRPALRWFLRGGSVIVLVLGMLTKECTFTVPLAAVLLDALVWGTPVKTSMRRALPLLLCLPIIPGLVLLTTWAQHDGVLRLTDALNIVNCIDLPVPHWHYAVTQLTVVVAYLRLLFWPAGLNLDPDLPLHMSLMDGPVLVALTIIVAMLAGSWMLYRRHRTDIRFAAAFAFTLWFFGTIVVSSGLVPLPDLMAEHRSYLPSIGVFAIVACLVDRWRTSWRGARWLAPAGVLACTLALSAATWQRNEVWRTGISLWQDTAAKSPGKFRVWGNLGAAYGNSGNYEEAVRSFRKAIELEPRFFNGWTNLANALNATHRFRESLDTSIALMKRDPKTERTVEVNFNVGVALFGVGRLDDGATVLNKLLDAAPTHLPAQMALASYYSQTHQPQKALYHYERAFALQPSNAALAQLVERSRKTSSLAGP